MWPEEGREQPGWGEISYKGSRRMCNSHVTDQDAQGSFRSDPAHCCMPWSKSETPCASSLPSLSPVLALSSPGPLKAQSQCKTRRQCSHHGPPNARRLLQDDVMTKKPPRWAKIQCICLPAGACLKHSHPRFRLRTFCLS